MAQSVNRQTAARIRRTEAYAEKLRLMFASTVNRIMAVNRSTPTLEPGEMFSFDSLTAKQRREVEGILNQLHSAATMSIRQGIKLEWEQANTECDRFLATLFAKKALKSPRFAAYTDRNTAAMDAFIARSDRGMNLSDRVWQSCRQLRDELEVALTVGIGEGASAQTLSRRVRSYLNDPDLMFRRFRYKDADGNWQLKWKKRIADPDRPGKYRFIDYDKDSYRDQWTGRGYYKSSAQNAMRLARTETNIAYRRADHERWNAMDFVLGQRVVLSHSHPEPDICDKLSAPNLAHYEDADRRGVYPKDFVFDGWHPQCFCFVVPVLVGEDEMQKKNEAFLRDEEYTPKGREVTDYPDEFKQWCIDNADRIEAARERGTEPYFVRNNAEAIENIIRDKDRQEERTLYSNDYCEEICARFKVKEDKSPQAVRQFFEASPWHKMDILKLDDDIRQTFSDFGVSDIDLMRTTITLKSRNSLRITWDGGPSGITLMRTFSIDKNGLTKVHHDLFALPKKYQGKGVSKSVFRNLYEQYQAAGVKYMDVFANIDIGGYTWAKYGFCTTDKNEAISAINFNTLSKKQKDEIIGIIDAHFTKNNAPFPMSKIAKLPYGKEALLGQCWDGVLDLTDPVQRKYFEDYIGFNNRGN